MHNSDRERRKKQLEQELSFHLSTAAYEQQQSTEHAELSEHHAKVSVAHGKKSLAHMAKARDVRAQLAKISSNDAPPPTPSDEERPEATSPFPHRNDRRRLSDIDEALHKELVKKAARGVSLLLMSFVASGAANVVADGEPSYLHPQRSAFLQFIASGEKDADGLPGWRSDSEVREFIATRTRKPLTDDGYRRFLCNVRRALWASGNNPELIQRENGMIRFAAREIRIDPPDAKEASPAA